MIKWLLTLVAFVQLILAARVFRRMFELRSGDRIPRHSGTIAQPDTVSIIVPVLNEEARLTPCLDGITAQDETVHEILVADGGSTDRTRDIVNDFASRDRRIRLVDTTPVPAGVNGKAWQLEVATRESSQSTPWILTIDADVRPDPELTQSLVKFAADQGLPSLSVATHQSLADSGDGLIHPSMLTTLVYRFGIPGTKTTDPHRVQANGQCFLVDRSTLEHVGGFASVVDSVCEDVTLARSIAAAGHQVGFFESDDLVSVAMYDSWQDTWTQWMRSLPMRDRYADWQEQIGLAEVLLVQAAPLWVSIIAGRHFGWSHPVTQVNLALLLGRLGVLAGTRRAYRSAPASYWFSPLSDLPIAVRLLRNWRNQDHVWRGRPFSSGDRR